MCYIFCVGWGVAGGAVHVRYIGGVLQWTSSTFVWRVRWTFSTFFCKLSPYLAVHVTVNYVDNFVGFNGELSGYSTSSSSLVFSVFFFWRGASHGPLSRYFVGRHRPKLPITCGVSHRQLSWFIVGLRTYVRELSLFFLGRLTMNMHDIILATRLSFMAIFIDRPNGELWVLSILNFSTFVRAVFRYSDSSQCIFFYILSDATWSFTAIYFFPGVSVWIISVFFGGRRWMHWRRCNRLVVVEK